MYKNYTQEQGIPARYIHKFLLIMNLAGLTNSARRRKIIMRINLTTLVLVAAIMQASAATYAQTITLKEKNATLENVFKDLRKQSGYDFYFDQDEIIKARPVTVNLKNTSLNEALNTCLAGQPFNFVIDDKTVVIKQKDVALPKVTAPIQVNTVTGVVKDSTGATIPGVSVLNQTTGGGVATDVNGAFKISANPGDVLVFSFVGYIKRSVTIGTDSQITVVLKEAANQLGAVVVTAFGISRSEKSLSYSTQQLSGDALTTERTDNLMNALSGKIAGATISPSASGLGGSVKVIFRGNKSFSGTNQPLYVIDGIQMANVSNQAVSTPSTNNGQPNSPYGGSTNVDAGDGISNLNPDDIESISFLKGSAASALYGSQGANGVVLITTKKGKAGKAEVDFSSSYTASNAVSEPKFQNSYGRTSPTANDSWGGGISGDTNNLGDFFRTGNNFTNSISLRTGTETAQTYLSYANTTATGIEPANSLQRNNFDLHETGKFFDQKLTVDGNVNYINQSIDNNPGLGFYYNPMVGLYLLPRGLDVNSYKNYESVSGSGLASQNWYTIANGTSSDNSTSQQNPWWIQYRNPNYATRNRVIMSGSLKYDFTNWISLKIDGNMDRSQDRYEQDVYQGTIPNLTKSSNGQFILDNQTFTQKYADALVNFNVPGTSVVKFDGVIGASILDNKLDGINLGPGNGLNIANLFVAQNVLVSSSNASTIAETHSQLQSVFANVNLSYANWLYLNATARNDWSSNLAFTNKDNFFYPSVGLSGVLTEVLKLPAAINYAKLRINYAEVGNTVPYGFTNPANYATSTGITLGTQAPFSTLKPERTKTYEGGIDLRFLKDNLTVSFSYYKTNTYNQFIQVTPTPASGYSIGYINAGNVENKGFEFVVGYNFINNSQFKWNSSLTGARNINKIIDVDSKDNIPQFILTGNYNTNYESVLATGGSYGDIYGHKLATDAQGRVEIGADGKPVINSNFVYIGNPNPKFTLGWDNSFNFKHVNLDFLVDGKFGGQVYSETQAIMDQYGVSAVSGNARKAGGVSINGVSATGTPVSTIDPKTWYTAIGGTGGATASYLYSATVVRLREASLGYTFPLNNRTFKSLKLAIVGRNLAYFYKKAPFDPETAMATGNGLSGIDVFGQPAVRTLGASLNVKF